MPCISLEEVIDDWLGGQEVELLKIDAQGFDLQVVRSAGTVRAPRTPPWPAPASDLSVRLECPGGCMLWVLGSVLFDDAWSFVRRRSGG